MHISVSVGDFPIFKNPEYLFSGLKKTGVDSIELITGIKSRFRFQKILKLSEKYDLPITSIHQPPWSIAPFLFDENFVREGTQIGVKKFVFHPLPKYTFSDEPMKKYLQKLSHIQEKFDVTVMLENMAVEIRPKYIDYLVPISKDTRDVERVLHVVKEYNLSMTLDTSHAYVKNPAEEKWFPDVFPYVADIHLSSFNNARDHLPVYMGDFQTKEFIQELKKREYKGILNLEVFYPGTITLFDYDFQSIQKSVEFIKSIH